MLKRDFVIGKIAELNGDLLKSPYKQLWTIDNPTLGYCYIVSEALYHYLDGEIKAYCISMDNGTHWYVKLDNNIHDFTNEQFDQDVDYSKGIGKGFFKGSIPTNKGYISKRGYAMAKHLELI